VPRCKKEEEKDVNICVLENCFGIHAVASTAFQESMQLSHFNSSCVSSFLHMQFVVGIFNFERRTLMLILLMHAHILYSFTDAVATHLHIDA
jgi:hypothetical protein